MHAESKLLHVCTDASPLDHAKSVQNQRNSSVCCDAELPCHVPCTNPRRRKLNVYQPTPQGTARFNEELRKKKEDELAHRQALEAQFGPETARLMLEIEQMRKPPKYRIKGTAADVQAVLSLPEYPTGEFEPPKRKSSKASQEGGSVSGRTASEASVALSHSGSTKVSGTNV